MIKNKTFEGDKEQFKEQVSVLVGTCIFVKNKKHFKECWDMSLTPEKAVKYLKE
jgi:hypothetical protein